MTVQVMMGHGDLLRWQYYRLRAQAVLQVMGRYDVDARDALTGRLEEFAHGDKSHHCMQMATVGVTDGNGHLCRKLQG